MNQEDKIIFTFPVLWHEWEYDGTAWIMEKPDGTRYLKMSNHDGVYVANQDYAQSESHVRGTIIDLQKQQIEYLKEKDPETKDALASVIRQTASQVPSNLLPPDLRSFVFSLNQ